MMLVSGKIPILLFLRGTLQRLTNKAISQHTASWILFNIASNQTTAKYWNTVSVPAEYQPKQNNTQRLMMVFPLPMMSQIFQQASSRYIGFPACNYMCKLANTARQYVRNGYFPNSNETKEVSLHNHKTNTANHRRIFPLDFPDQQQ